MGVRGDCPGLVHRCLQVGFAGQRMSPSVRPMRGRRVQAVVIGLVFMALGASACSGPDAVTARAPVATPTAVAGPPEATRSQTPSVPATSVATSPARVIPAAARAHTNKGAEAFARYYLQRVNESWVLADASLLTGLSEPACKTCSNFVRTAISLRESQTHYDGPASTLGVAVVLPRSTANKVIVQIVDVQNSRRILDMTGKVVETVPPVPSLSEVLLTWAGLNWSVREIKDVSS